MTEVMDANADQIVPTTPQRTMQTDGDEDANSISGESDLSGCSIDERFSFSQSYTRTFDAEHEPISLLNLSISPISANHDDEVIKDMFANSDQHPFIADGDGNDDDDDDDGDDNERISLDEITAQINTPPPSHSKSASKRLNLETIFEGVFLETPPKKRRCDPWRMRAINEVTAEERISAYVYEQQQTVERNTVDSAEFLCNLFDERIDINLV